MSAINHLVPCFVNFPRALHRQTARLQTQLHFATQRWSHRAIIFYAPPPSAILNCSLDLETFHFKELTKMLAHKHSSHMQGAFCLKTWYQNCIVRVLILKVIKYCKYRLRLATTKFLLNSINLQRIVDFNFLLFTLNIGDALKITIYNFTLTFTSPIFMFSITWNCTGKKFWDCYSL